jgi:hypothetical protein
LPRICPSSAAAFSPTTSFTSIACRGYASVGDVVNAPDAFGFFRPVTQATLFIEALIHPSTAPLFG